MKSIQMELGWTSVALSDKLQGQSGTKAKTLNLLVWIIYSWGTRFKKLYILFFFIWWFNHSLMLIKDKIGRWCYEFQFVRPIKVLLVCTVLKILCHLHMGKPSKCCIYLLCSVCVCLFAAQGVYVLKRFTCTVLLFCLFMHCNSKGE